MANNAHRNSETAICIFHRAKLRRPAIGPGGRLVPLPDVMGTRCFLNYTSDSLQRRLLFPHIQSTIWNYMCFATCKDPSNMQQYESWLHFFSPQCNKSISVSSNTTCVAVEWNRPVFLVRQPDALTQAHKPLLDRLLCNFVQAAWSPRGLQMTQVHDGSPILPTPQQNMSRVSATQR